MRRRRTPSAVRHALGGARLATSAPLATAALDLAVTPLLLVRLGVDGFGVYVVASALRGVLSSLDGGLGPATGRLLAASVGAGDRRRTSSVLATASLAAAVVTGAVAVLVAVLAPELAALLRASAGLRSSATVLVRLLMALLLVAALRCVAERVLVAEGRFAYLGASAILGRGAYVVTTVLLVGGGHGLVALALARAAEEGVLLVATLAGARRAVVGRGWQLLGRRDLAGALHDAGQVQLRQLAGALGGGAGAIVVGVLLPVRLAATYGIGANVAALLAGFPSQAFGPVATALSATVAAARRGGPAAAARRGGPAAALGDLARLQRLWVRAVAPWFLAAGLAAAFGIAAWLGPGERLAGIAAAILLVGQAPATLGMVTGALSTTLVRPVSSWRVLAAAASLALAGVLGRSMGLLGVPFGLAAGQAAVVLWRQRAARRGLGLDLRGVLGDVPKAALAVGAAVAVPLELVAVRVAPAGEVGLLACAFAALAGLGACALVLGADARPVASPAPSDRGEISAADPVAPSLLLAPGPPRPPALARGALVSRPDEAVVVTRLWDRESPAPTIPVAPAPMTVTPITVTPMTVTPMTVTPAAPEPDSERAAPEPEGPRGEGGPEGAGEEAGLPAFVAQLELTRARLRALRRSGVLVLVQLAPVVGDGAAGDGAAGDAALEAAAGALARAVRQGDEIAVVGDTTLAAILELDGPGRPGARGPRPADLAAIERRLVAAAAGPGVPAALRAVAVLL